MIKKFLKKIFKIISYGVFLKIYGKIDKTIESGEDNRVRVKTINLENDIKYKVYKIHQGRLYTDRIQDTAFIVENKIVEGPSFQLRHTPLEKKTYNSNIRDNIVFKKGTPRILRKFNGNILSLLTGGGGNDNYWHWLFNVLPRLEICNRELNIKEVDYFLFPSLLKKFQNQTLDFLKIPKTKRISSEKFRHVKAKEIIATDDPILISGNATEDNQHIPIWVIKWLKSNFLKGNSAKDNKDKKKIYIDRRNSNINYAEARSVINEEEIRNYLLEKGFTPVKLHEIEFSKQIDLFHNAECVAGLHGAGFANVIFCKPNTKIIEFRNASLLPVIENLVKKNDLKYSAIISKEKHDYDFPSQQGSIHVSLKELSKIIEEYKI